VWEGAKKIVEGVFGTIVNVIRDIIVGVIGVFGGLASGIKNVVLDIASAILGYLTPVFNIINGMIDIKNALTGSHDTKIDVTQWQNDLAKMRSDYEATNKAATAVTPGAYDQNADIVNEMRLMRQELREQREQGTVVEMDGEKVGQIITSKIARFDGI
jgi:hypothetical protein